MLCYNTSTSLLVFNIVIISLGAELLATSDNKGQLPADLSKSDAMSKLLQEYDSQLCAKLSESTIKDPTESDSSTESTLSKENLGSAPSLKSFREYSIYLDCLICLLCTYCDMFNLYDYVSQKNTIVSSHSDKSCCHFVDKDICSEDAAIISEMSSLIETFMESITKNASKSELLIDIELIPFKGFVASLKTS